MKTEGFILGYADSEALVGGISPDGSFTVTYSRDKALVFDTPQQILAAVQRRNASLREVNPYVSLGRLVASRVVIGVTTTPEAVIDSDEGAVVFNWYPLVAEGEEQKPVFVYSGVTLEDLADRLAEDEPIERYVIKRSDLDMYVSEFQEDGGFAAYEDDPQDAIFFDDVDSALHAINERNRNYAHFDYERLDVVAVTLEDDDDDEGDERL